jgi:DNA primase
VKELMALRQKEGDWDSAIELIQKIKKLEEIKKVLAKALGERIILRW